jgi:hypothetical protein
LKIDANAIIDTNKGTIRLYSFPKTGILLIGLKNSENDELAILSEVFI